jgi:SAM-dependent methyltransferase
MQSDPTRKERDASRLKALIVESLKSYGFDKVSRVPLERQAEEFLSEARVMEQVALLRRYVPTLSGARLLEVGSGYGTFVAVANRDGLCNALGVEPGADAYGSAFDISRKLLVSMGVDQDLVKNAPGEALPFAHDSFDVVWCTNVLEHVQDPPQVLAEMTRVLKPGGTAVVVVPNYGSWWEGHYGVLFPPHCPKIVFKAVVKLLGRDTSFVDTLQFVTHGKLRRWLVPLRNRVEVVTYGVEVWEERVRSLAFSTWASLESLKKLVELLHRLHLVDAAVALGKRLHWETPLILVFRKLETPKRNP